ncbi:hypothetical protein K7Z00_28870 [Rhodococcus ruber]|nr:hypothetical protein [Rhodococcus ruber]
MRWSHLRGTLKKWAGLSAVTAFGLTGAVLNTAPAAADPRCPNNDPWYGFCVGGRILEEFNQAGGFPFFGNATNAELNALNNGRWQPFEKDSSIYWHPNVSNGHANQVGGQIRAKWGQLGWEGGTLQYPTTRELPTRKPNGRFNHFQGGSIYWSPETGPHSVWGKIRDYWAGQDWEMGSLGFPSSDEYALNGGRAQDFQGARVQWFPTLGTTLPANPTPGSYSSYDMNFQLWSPPLSGWNPAAIKNEVIQHFDTYFTFHGCGNVLYVGKECNLQTSVGVDAPIRVTHVTDDGFAFKSLPGHPEGADRTIAFRFYYALIGTLGQYEVRMRVSAWGPVSAGSVLGPLNEITLARPAWTTFANNLHNKIPNASTRYVPCCGYGDVSPAPAPRRTQSQFPGPVEEVSPNDEVIRLTDPVDPLPGPAGVVPLLDPETRQLLTSMPEQGVGTPETISVPSTQPPTTSSSIPPLSQEITPPLESSHPHDSIPPQPTTSAAATTSTEVSSVTSPSTAAPTTTLSAPAPGGSLPGN